MNEKTFHESAEVTILRDCPLDPARAYVKRESDGAIYRVKKSALTTAPPAPVKPGTGN